MLVFFTNFSLTEFEVRYLVLFLLFSVIERLGVILDGKSSQEYPGPTLFLLNINDLPDDVVCDIAIYADDTSLSSK